MNHQHRGNQYNHVTETDISVVCGVLRKTRSNIQSDQKLWTEHTMQTWKMCVAGRVFLGLMCLVFTVCGFCLLYRLCRYIAMVDLFGGDWQHFSASVCTEIRWVCFCTCMIFCYVLFPLFFISDCTTIGLHTNGRSVIHRSMCSGVVLLCAHYFDYANATAIQFQSRWAWRNDFFFTFCFSFVGGYQCNSLIVPWLLSVTICGVLQVHTCKFFNFFFHEIVLLFGTWLTIILR